MVEVPPSPQALGQKSQDCKTTPPSKVYLNNGNIHFETYQNLTYSDVINIEIARIRKNRYCQENKHFLDYGEAILVALDYVLGRSVAPDRHSPHA